MKKTHIEIKQLSKRFNNSAKPALENISLDIPEGEICGIIGMSGAGKSTLMRILSGLETPCEGQVSIHGKEVSLLNAKEWREMRKQIGVIFQHFNLFSSRTAAENICFPMEIYGVPHSEQQERCEELLALVGLENKGNRYPSQLSGGEKQRVGIARALANRPQLLLCDEATSALDAKTMHGILQLIQKLNRQLGLTIAFITHQMEVIKHICTYVAVLGDGQLVEEGKTLDVLLRPKHPLTKHLLHTHTHHLSDDFMLLSDPSKTLVRLCFEGDKAQQPLISRMVKNFDVEASILLGGIDCLQNKIVGNLVIELSGESNEMNRALTYLKEHHVHCEVINDR